MKTEISQEVGRVVVDSWISDDYKLWYRKFNDGWIEQGGYNYGEALNTTTTVSFTIPFVEMPTLLFGGYGVTGVDSYEGGFNSVTTTGFKYIGCSATRSSANSFSWCAVGY